MVLVIAANRGLPAWIAAAFKMVEAPLHADRVRA